MLTRFLGSNIRCIIFFDSRRFVMKMSLTNSVSISPSLQFLPVLREFRGIFLVTRDLFVFGQKISISRRSDKVTVNVVFSRFQNFTKFMSSVFFRGFCVKSFLSLLFRVLSINVTLISCRYQRSEVH